MLNRACLERDTKLVLRNAFKVMVVDNKKELLGYVGKFLESHAFEGNFFHGGFFCWKRKLPEFLS